MKWINTDTVVDEDGNSVPNPISKIQAYKTWFKNINKTSVTSWRAVQAAETARQQAIDDANSEIVISDGS